MTESTIPLIEWLKCRRFLNRYWTDAQITDAMAALMWTVRDLTSEEGFLKVPTWHKSQEVLKNRYRFTREESHPRCHDYTKRVEHIGSLVRVPDQYQGLKHPDLIRKLMFDRFPFMKDEIYFKKFPKKIKFDFQKYIRLTEIPESMRKMTVEDLINHEHVQDIIESRSRWKFYGADQREDQDYQFYLYCDTDETENTYDHENQCYREKDRGTLYIHMQDWFKGNVDAFVEKSQYDKEKLRNSAQFIALKEHFREYFAEQTYG